MGKALLITSFLSSLLFLTVIIIGSPTSFFGKAESQNLVVIDNSYLFASPLTAQAGNKEKIRVTIFILNDKGLGVPNKKVLLNVTPTLNIYEVQPETDKYGKTLFDISSSSEGEYLLKGEVSGLELSQKVRVSFSSSQL